MGSLPGGPEAVTALTAETRTADTDGAITVTCGDKDFFAADSVDHTGDGAPDTIGPNTFVLNKTARGTAEDEKTQVAATEFNRAMEITVSKVFVAGNVFAELDTTGGTDEPLERGYLYNDCGVGTAPADIRGDWQAVRITTKRQPFENGVAIDSDNDGSNGIQSSVPDVVLTKVCIRLDSTPGAVKCYVMDGAVTDDTKDEMIALYDGEALHPVVPEAMFDTNLVDNSAASLFAATDFPNANKLCEIFDEE